MSHRCDGCANAATCADKQALVAWCEGYWPAGVKRDGVKRMGTDWEEDEDDGQED